MSTTTRKRRIEEEGESPAPKASKQANGEKRRRSKSPTRQRTRIMKNGIPLHALPAYNLWLEDTKKKMGFENIPKAAAQQSSMFAKEWKNLSEEKKAKWEQKAAQEKIKWKREVADFYDSHGFWHDDEDRGDAVDGKKKKEKKEKEPRVLSGYNLYIKEQRDIVKDQEFEGQESKDIMVKLGKRWKALSDQEKEEYKTRAIEMGPVERASRSRRSSKKVKQEEEEKGEEEEEEEEEVAETEDEEETEENEETEEPEDEAEEEEEEEEESDE